MEQLVNVEGFRSCWYYYSAGATINFPGTPTKTTVWTVCASITRKTFKELHACREFERVTPTLEKLCTNKNHILPTQQAHTHTHVSASAKYFLCPIAVELRAAATAWNMQQLTAALPLVVRKINRRNQTCNTYMALFAPLAEEKQRAAALHGQVAKSHKKALLNNHKLLAMITRKQKWHKSLSWGMRKWCKKYTLHGGEARQLTYDICSSESAAKSGPKN